MSLAWVAGDVALPWTDVEKGADCAVGHTTTASPPSSGAKHSGIRVGDRKPMTPTAMTSSPIKRS